MSNLMKRLLCVLLALVMVMALCACGGSDEDTDTRKRGDKTTEEETTTEETTTEPAPTLVGEWEAYLDFTDYLNDELANIVGKEDVVSDFTLRVTVKFKESGAITLEYDEDHMEEMLNNFAADFWVVLVDYTAEASGLTADEVIAYYAEEGITEDNLLEAMELDSLFDYYQKMKGYYLLDGEELFIAEEEEDVEDAEPIEIEYDGGDTFTMVDGKDLDEIFGEEIDEILPVEFTRID